MTTEQGTQAHRLCHLVSAGKLQTAPWALQTSAFPLPLVESLPGEELGGAVGGYSIGTPCPAMEILHLEVTLCQMER